MFEPPVKMFSPEMQSCTCLVTVSAVELGGTGVHKPVENTLVSTLLPEFYFSLREPCKTIKKEQEMYLNGRIKKKNRLLWRVFQQFEIHWVMMWRNR